MSKTVVVFGSSSLSPTDPIYQEGVLLGAMLARQGWKVLSGGYFGIMGAVSLGASEEEGEALGVTSETFTFRDGPNPWLTREIPAKNTVDRLKILIDMADAAVAMPGNVGTFNEIMMVLTLWKCGETDLPLILWKDPFESALKGLVEKELVPLEGFSSAIFVENSVQTMEALKKVLFFQETLR
jgi:uncharacterized protein (TIGR00730 family)